MFLLDEQSSKRRDWIYFLSLHCTESSACINYTSNMLLFSIFLLRFNFSCLYDAEVNLAPSHDNILMERICFILKIYRQIWIRLELFFLLFFPPFRWSLWTFLPFRRNLMKSVLRQKFDVENSSSSNNRAIIVNELTKLSTSEFPAQLESLLINLKELSGQRCVKMSAW